VAIPEHYTGGVVKFDDSGRIVEALSDLGRQPPDGHVDAGA
jgi:hypothetical protein